MDFAAKNGLRPFPWVTGTHVRSMTRCSGGGSRPGVSCGLTFHNRRRARVVIAIGFGTQTKEESGYHKCDYPDFVTCQNEARHCLESSNPN